MNGPNEIMEPGASKPQPTTSIDNGSIPTLDRDGPPEEVMATSVFQSESFEDILKNKPLTSNNIIDVMKKALTEVVELEITTWVSEPSDPISSVTGDLENPKPGNRMYSKINIIEGDITNEVGSQFIASGPYTELQQFHLDQVKESREIIQKNIESLQKLFHILTEIVKKRT